MRSSLGTSGNSTSLLPNVRACVECSGRAGAEGDVTYRCLDLFCGAGGASMGLHRAGFDVTGVDIKPQPRYPFKFVQADAMEYPLEGFDFIWASPPCQRYTMAQNAAKNAEAHPDLIPALRYNLTGTATPWVIENV